MSRRPTPFDPRFDDVHKDVERYLTSLGKRTKRADGMIVFTGYDSGRDHVIALYFEREAWPPLVRYFRSWNWEQGYNKFLLRLSEELRKRRDWPHLRTLWEGVLSKRRVAYNAAWKMTRRDPAELGPEPLARARALLLETLERLAVFAGQIGTPEDGARYDAMIQRVAKGGKA